MTATILFPPAKEVAPPLGHHRNGDFHSVAQPETKALKLIANLCYALKHEQIAYCHWKSNTAIDKSASAENDLDLLIRREDVARFTALLYGLGFKQATLRPDKQLPGVLDFYGFDRRSGTLVHVHAHYQLILGHDGAKNYRVPIENAYIATSVQDEHFMVPLPEFELIVFVIRMILKHATWDAMLGLEGNFAKSEKSEWDDLTTRSDIDHMYLLLEKHLPFLERDLFDRCMNAVHKLNAIPRARHHCPRTAKGAAATQSPLVCFLDGRQNVAARHVGHSQVSLPPALTQAPLGRWCRHRLCRWRRCRKVDGG